MAPDFFHRVDARQRNVPDPLQPARAVNLRCLILLDINAGNRGHVDDGAPAGGLPDVGEVDDREEIVRLAQERHGLGPEERAHDRVHQAPLP